MKTETQTPREFIGIFTCDGLDQICETTAQAAAETRDLRAMGCDVWRYVARDESTLDAIGDWIRDGRSFAVARARVESGQFAPETVERNAEAEAAEAARNARRATPPATLNGYPVTATESHGNGFHTVMVIRDAEAAPDHKSLAVATWWRGLGESWAWGHYIHGDDSTTAQAEAESVFREVGRRNFRRAPVAHLMAD